MRLIWYRIFFVSKCESLKKSIMKNMKYSKKANLKGHINFHFFRNVVGISTLFIVLK